MNKLEQFVLKITRGFGLILMALVLVIASIILLVQFGSYTKSLFAKKYPSIQFEKSDFVKTAEPTSPAVLKEEDKLAAKVAAAFMPIFEADMADYLQQNEATLFRDEAKRAEMRQTFENDAKKVFQKNAQAYIKSWLLDFSEKNYSDFADKAITYVNAAAKEGVRPFIAYQKPVATPKQSDVFMTFARKYNAEYRDLQRANASSSSDQIAQALSYGGLFFLIFVALLGGMMLAVMRLENKFESR